MAAGSIVGRARCRTSIGSLHGSSIAHGGVGYCLPGRAAHGRDHRGRRARHAFLRFGDRVRIEMLDATGQSIFGAIDQTVRRVPAPGLTMLRLYTYFRSSAAYRVRIALALKGLAYDGVPVHLLRGGGEQLQAAYRA